MAAVCEFTMKICGNKDNIRKFTDAMQQIGPVFMGRGCYISKKEETEDGMILFGETKGSITGSLIYDAIDMRENPKSCIFPDDKGNIFHADEIGVEFKTLIELCEDFNINCEVYSESVEELIQEHIIVQDGESSYEEAELDFPEHDEDGFMIGDEITGGFSNYGQFEVTMPSIEKGERE